MRKLFKSLFGEPEAPAKRVARFDGLRELLERRGEGIESLVPRGWAGPGGAVVAERWAALEAALESAASLSEGQMGMAGGGQTVSDVTAALGEFLSCLDPEYSRWSYRLLFSLPDGPQKLAALPRLSSLSQPAFDFFMAFLNRHLASQAKTIEEQEWDRVIPIDVLFAVYVLALDQANLLHLVQVGLVNRVHDVFEAATKLSFTFSKLSREARDSYLPTEQFDFWIHYLSIVCSLCLRLFQSIMFPMFGWHRLWRIKTSFIDGLDDADDCELIRMAAALGEEARPTLVSDMAMASRLRDLFAVVSALETLHTRISELRVILVETVAILGYGSPPPQLMAVLRSHGLIDAVVASIGWLREDLSFPRSQHYLLQVTSLQSLATVSERSSENAKRLAQLGFFERVLDVVLCLVEEQENSVMMQPEGGVTGMGLTGERVNANASSSLWLGDDEIEEDEPDAFLEIAEAREAIGAHNPVPLPRDPLDLLHGGGECFRTLLVDFLDAFRVLVFGLPLSPPPPPELLAERMHLISFLLDVFNIDVRQTSNNTRVRTLMRKTGTFAQAHILSYLIRCLQDFPDHVDDLLESLRKSGLWERLFGDFFFRPLGSPTMVMLEDCVWGLLEHVGTRNEKSNSHEVKFCLALLPQHALRASRALTTLFTRNATATKAYDGAQMLQAVVDAISAVRFSSNAGHKSMELHRWDFVAVLRVLAFSFCLPRVREAAESQLGAVELFVQLLFDPTSRFLALDCLLTTMETAAERTSLSVFQNYAKLLVEETEILFARAMLAGIRRTIKRVPACKKMWRKVDIFETTLIPVLANADGKETELCCDVLQTLTAIQSRSKAAKEQFRAKVPGFHRLLIPFFQQASPGDQSVLNHLISMMLDGEDSVGFIRNTLILSVMFEMWHVIDQERVIETIFHLVSSKHANLGIVCASGLTNRLLDLIATDPKLRPDIRLKILALLQVLVCHSISSQELAQLLSLLRSNRLDESFFCRPSFWPDLLAVVQRAVDASHAGPRAYFSLDGAKRAISLPSILVPRTGFSFSVWLYFEHVHEIASIFAFSNGEEEGVELRCTPQGDLLYGPIGGETRMVGSIEAGVWSHLVLSHQNAGILIGRSEVRVCINGVMVALGTAGSNNLHSTLMPYPVCPVFTSCFVAGNFFGRMGAIYVFTGALSPQQAGKIFSLGSSYSGVFFADSLDPIHSSPVEVDLMQALNASLVMSYNSVAREQGQLFDSKLGPVAAVTEGVSSCWSASFNRSLSCIGGISVLLPLVAQLNHHIFEVPKGEWQPAPLPPNDFGHAGILTVLHILMQLLKESEVNQRDFVSVRGMAILGQYMRKWHSSWIASDVIDKLVEMESILHLPELRKQYLEEVLFNFGALVYADVSVQMYYVATLRQAFSAKMLRQVLGVQHLLDVLRIFYWETQAVQGFSLPPIVFQGAVVGHRPESSEVLRGLRLEFLRLLDFLVQPQLREEDSTSVLNFLLTCNEAPLIHEVLHFLLVALSNENQTLFLKHVSSGGGLVDTFVTLLSNDVEEVRVGTLLLFSRLPVLDNSDFLVRVSSLFMHVLRTRKLTVQMIAIFLSVAVSRARSLHPKIFLNMRPGDDVPERVMSGDPIVRNLAALDMMLGLRSSVSVSLVMLKHLATLLDSSYVNVEVFLMLPDWHLKLVQLNSRVEIISEESEEDSEARPLVAACKTALVGLFQRLFVRSLRKEARGSDLMRETLAALILSGGGSLTSNLGLGGGILLGVTRCFSTEAAAVVARTAPDNVMQDYDKKRGNIVFPNLVKLALLVEEFVYYFSSNHDCDSVLEEFGQARRGASPRSTDTPLDHSTSNPLDLHSPRMERRRGFSFSAPVSVSRSSVSGFFKMEGQANFDRNDALAAATLSLLMQHSFHFDSTWKGVVGPASSSVGPAIASSPAAREGEVRNGGGRRISVRFALDLVRYTRNQEYLECALSCLADRKMQLTQFPEDALLVVGYLKDRLSQRDEHSSLVLPVISSLLRTALPMLSTTAGKILSLPPTSHWDLLLSSDSSVVLEEWASPRWMTLAQYMDGKIASAHRDINLSFWSGIRARLLISLGEVAEILDQMAAARSSALAEYAERMAESDLRRGGAERSRLETCKATLRMRRSKAERRAVELLETSVQIRSPWAPADARNPTYWKRDHSETSSYLRLRLRPNKKFDAHLDKASSLFKPVVDEISPETLNDILRKGSMETMSQLMEDGLPQSPIQSSTGREDGTDDGGLGMVAPSSPSSPLIDNMQGVEGSLNDSVLLPVPSDPSKTVLQVQCSRIKPIKKHDGTLRLTLARLYFTSDAPQEEAKAVKELCWLISDLTEMYFRRYLLRDSALEIKFRTQHGSVLLNFVTAKDRQRMFQKILDLKPPNLIYRESSNPETILRNSKMTELWMNHSISNLDYLMHLNMMSGRTYNDLGQYPVFPWILSCYGEPSVHLEDPGCYRDLSKPIGALNPERLASFLERYRSIDKDSEMPPFMYGSHYSNSGSVLFYLVRMEPYTSYHLALQGGRFDQADRMFHSVRRTWENVTSISSDVKELTPEWFYQPEMFRNDNGFELGYRQSGEALNHVVLPDWASGPDEFVKIHRAALESDFVSANLHNWIDLIFGYKQRGEAAVTANNVFFHLTYGGAVNWNALKDPRERQAVEDQIRHFGQMPAQLLRSAHPQRKQRVVRPGGLLGAGASIGSGDPWVVERAAKFSMHVLPLLTEPVMFVGAMVRSCDVSPEQVLSGGSSALPSAWKRFLTVSQSRVASIHVWSTSAEPEGTVQIDVDSNLGLRKAIGVPLAAGLKCSWRLFALSPWAMVSGGHHDCSLVVSAMDSNHNNPVQIQTLQGHRGVVTCIDMDGSVIVSGSRDCTLLLWTIAAGMDGSVRFRVADRAKGAYFGHRSEVCCLCISERLDLCVSASVDGSVLVHELRSRRLIRELLPPAKVSAGSPAISLIKISTWGDIFLFSNQQKMWVFSINGTKLAYDDSVRDEVTCGFLTRNGEYVVTGSADCCVTVRALSSLEVVHKLRSQSPVCSITLTPDEHNIVLGLEDGKLCVISGTFPSRRGKK